MSTAYEQFQSFALPYWTGTTQAATGATTLVAAPGAGLRIAVDGLRVVITTDTTLRIPFNFYENTTTAGMLYREIALPSVVAKGTKMISMMYS